MKPETRRPLVFDIHRYALDDGPGIRTTVFFKGCPLSCIWCHNPEGIQAAPELCHYNQRCIGCGDCVAACPRQAISLDAQIEINRELCNVCGQCADQCPAKALSIKGRYHTVEELTAQVLKDERFYINSSGGVTLSGGEPTLHSEYLHLLLQGLKSHGIHIALQTCGLFEWQQFASRVLPWVDLIYFDLKCMDDTLHRQWTGRSNQPILSNFAKLVEAARDKMVCTIPLISGMTADKDNIRNLAHFIGARHDLPYRLQPYHPGVHFKAEVLGKQANTALPLHAMAPDQYHDIETDFKTIVNHLRKRS